VLLLKKPNGQWDLPGGKLEKGEAWIDGLVREVYEETGLKVARARWVAGWKKKCSKHERAIKGVFLCRLDRKSKKSRIEISDEHVKGRFVSLKQIKNLFLPEEYAQAIGIAARKINA
jgi:8-oxo-dGTP pyrophosphatase MutT (NUDIX family)